MGLEISKVPDISPFVRVDYPIHLNTSNSNTDNVYLLLTATE